MPAGATISIRWVLDVVDKGAGDKLLKQDRAIRTSLLQTDTAYKRTANTAVSASGRQTQASSRVAAARERENRSILGSSDALKRYDVAQREALAIGSRVLSQIDRTTGAYARQARATKAARDEQSRLSGLLGKTGGVAGGIAGIGGSVLGGVGNVARTAGLGVLATATGLTIGGLKRGTEIRAGAAGIQGISGVDPRTATALAVIAQAEQVQARGLGQAFSTLGKQVVGLEKERRTGKPGAATEGFARLGISGRQVAGLQNNLPGLFDLVFQRAQRLPGAQQASTLKTFLGRGASLAGQVELAGPLAKQIGTVRGQLGDLDPKKLQELHETEIRVKEVTTGLELSFAQTFGPPLIKLFDLITPAVKPFGDALKTAIVEPIKFVKDNAPGVIGSVIKGFTGDRTPTPRRGIQGAPPILGRPGTATAGTRRTAGDAETAARANAQPPTTLERIGHVIGVVSKQIAVGATFIGKTASEAGKELFDAFKPAAPFLQHILLPLLKELGKGTLEVSKFLLGALVVAFHAVTLSIKVTSTILGGLTNAVLAAYKWLVRLNDSMARGLSNIGKFLGSIPGTIGSFAGKVGAAAGRLASAAARGIASLPGKVVHYASEAGSAVVHTLGGWIGKAGSVGAKIANAVVHGVGSIPGKLGNLADSVLGAFSDFGKKIVHAIGSAIREAPGAIIDAIKSLIPGPIRGAAEKLLGLFSGRSGGVVRPRGERKRFAAGGMVDAMVSPGEQVLYGGSSWTVPGAHTGADSVFAQLPVGAAVLTGDGQRRMSAGASLGEAIATQAPHFRTGGFVSTAYGPPWGGIEGGGQTATGVDLHNSPRLYIVAVDPAVIPLHSKLKITPNPFNYSGTFSAEDTGGAIKGNRIDFYDWKGRADQNAWGRRSVNVTIGGKGGAIGSAGTGSSNVTRSLSLGASHTRAGLLFDALSQGIEAGASGLTAAEIGRANRGARGAERSPVATAIAEALGPISETLKTSGEAGGAGGKAGRLPTGVSIPSGTWNPKRKPIDRWIQPYLSWGSTHGWPGIVESGFRTRAEGTAIYNSGVRPAAKPGTSNHEQPNYPGGAVDVTEAPKLASVLPKRSGPHLLQWAGARDPVHFSHPHGGSYRRGGVIGRARGIGGVSRLIATAGNKGQFGAAIRAFEESLAGLASDRLNDLVTLFTRAARHGGSSAVVQSFQAAISAVEEQIGLRIGELRDSIAKRTGGVERGQGSIDRYLRFKGIDPGSQAGLGVQIAFDAQAVASRKRSVADARKALGEARRTGKRKVIDEAAEELAKAQEDLQEAVVKGVEDQRSVLAKAAEDVKEAAERATEAVRTAAQEIVDTASSSVQYAQNSLTGLDISQRVSRTAETAGGERERASAIESQLVPVLRGAKAAAENQLAVLKATSAGAGELQQATLAVQSAGNEISSALADAADLIRQSAEQASQDVVDTASHGVSLAQLGQQRLELNERLAGTYEAGGAERSGYITTTLIPALQNEIAALNAQMATASAQGDLKLAQQIADAVFQRENDVKQATLDATEQIAENTAQRKVGGSLGFAYGAESVTDSILAVGDGA